MPHYVPFEMSLSVYPYYNKRYEYIYDLERLGIKVYNAISVLANVTLANPPSGRSRTYNRFGTIVKSAAIKPFFGDIPALLTFGGYYLVSGSPIPIHPNIQVIVGNQVKTGSQAALWKNRPVSTVETNATTLRTNILAALSAVTSIDGSALKMYRYTFNSIQYGD